jgi:hypothetical protein
MAERNYPLKAKHVMSRWRARQRSQFWQPHEGKATRATLAQRLYPHRLAYIWERNRR